MDTVCFVERIEAHAVRLAASSARRESRHMEVSGQATTVAEIGFRRPHAEGINSALPAAEHRLAVPAFNCGVDRLVPIRPEN